MTNTYAQHAGRRIDLPQSEQADTRQVPNSAGGFSFAVDDWMRAQRFLILGAEGGSYYATERKLTRENATAIDRCLAADPIRTVALIQTISESGRAPKNDPAIFALALAASHANPKARRAALDALPAVCRTGSHFLQFVSDVRACRGWGRGLRRACGNWIAQKDANSLAYQMVKYGQRKQWAQRDVIRLAHVGVHSKVTDPNVAALLRWVVCGREGMGERDVKRKSQGGKVSQYGAQIGELPRIIEGFERVRVPSLSESDVVTLVNDYGLTHEMVPSQYLGSAAVWGALLAKMPMHAMVRNLGRMTANGLLVPGSEAAQLIALRLRDQARIKKARLHPMAILLAARTYASGHGLKGSLTWSPVKPIVDALDDAFYLGFDWIEPTGKSIQLALDVSGSMSAMMSCGPVSCREGAAVMAMVTARTEPNYDIVGFAEARRGAYGGQWGGGDPLLTPVGITARSSLPDAIAAMAKVPMGGTDCSLPMRAALAAKRRFDAFFVYTDSETWIGPTHPHRALTNYRSAMGVDARLAVIAMTANEFTIADPSDAGMLDVVGFDTATPALLADFIRDERTFTEHRGSYRDAATEEDSD